MSTEVKLRKREDIDTTASLVEAESPNEDSASIIMY